MHGSLRFTVIKKVFGGLPLVVQWLSLCTSNVGGPNWIPVWGTKITHAAWCGWKEKPLGPCIHQGWWSVVPLGGSLNPFTWRSWKKCTHPLPFLSSGSELLAVSGGHFLDQDCLGVRSSVPIICCLVILSCQMLAAIGPLVESARRSEQSHGNSPSTKPPSLDAFSLGSETLGSKLPCGMMSTQTPQPHRAL